MLSPGIAQAVEKHLHSHFLSSKDWGNKKSSYIAHQNSLSFYPLENLSFKFTMRFNHWNSRIRKIFKLTVCMERQAFKKMWKDWVKVLIFLLVLLAGWMILLPEAMLNSSRLKYFVWMRLTKFSNKALNKKSRKFLVKFTKLTKIKFKSFSFQQPFHNGSNSFLNNIKEKMLPISIWSKITKFVPQKQSNIMLCKFQEWENLKLLGWLKKWSTSMEDIKREF